MDQHFANGSSGGSSGHLDPRFLDDAQLIVLARDHHLAARDELLLRYYGWTGQLIDAHAQRYRVPWAERQDVHQDAVFWILQAVNRYRIEQLTSSKGCSFRSFLYQVVRARMIDFVRSRSRLEHRFDRSGLASAVLEGRDFGVHGSVPGLRALEDRDDPSRTAQQHEAATRLRAALSDVDPVTGQLWVLTSDQGMTLRNAAVTLGISYDAAKRLKRKLLARLRQVLKEAGANDQ